MTSQQITADRLTRWQKRLDSLNATPLALAGIGQGSNSGQLVICIPENGVTDSEVAKILRSVADQLSARGD